MSQTLLIVVLALIALGAITFPVLVGHERYADQKGLDADVRRYRDALRDGTLCERCRTPNPAGSRYCGECGRSVG